LTLRNVFVTVGGMQVCAALADPIRVEIVELLAERDMSAGEIADRFPVSRPAVSRHLRVLRESDLVTVREEAQRRVYSLNPSPLDDLGEWMERNRRLWERRLDRLGQHLDRMAEDERTRDDEAKRAVEPKRGRDHG
jgi:DNA-binding transcriptional ArsR family regulator